jgi:hypothetical protein
MTDRQETLDIDNSSVALRPSKSFYQTLLTVAERSPGATVSSICALFITIILAIIVPSLLGGYFCKSS